jgi:hypothetical protein
LAGKPVLTGHGAATLGGYFDRTRWPDRGSVAVSGAAFAGFQRLRFQTLQFHPGRPFGLFPVILLMKVSLKHRTQRRYFHAAVSGSTHERDLCGRQSASCRKYFISSYVIGSDFFWSHLSSKSFFVV